MAQMQARLRLQAVFNSPFRQRRDKTVLARQLHATNVNGIEQLFQSARFLQPPGNLPQTKPDQKNPHQS